MNNPLGRRNILGRQQKLNALQQEVLNQVKTALEPNTVHFIIKLLHTSHDVRANQYKSVTKWYYLVFVLLMKFCEGGILGLNHVLELQFLYIL